MTKSRILALAAGLALFGMPGAAQAKFINCRLDYQVRTWSIFYKNITGSGIVTCSNGESAPVTLKLHGGGPTVGVANVKGTARFSEDPANTQRLAGEEALAPRQGGDAPWRHQGRTDA